MPEGSLTQDDFTYLHAPEIFAQRESALATYQLPAAEMYTGQQHVRLMRGIEAAQATFDIDLWIVSAGYGLIHGTREIVPYEMTFQGMKAQEIDAWAAHLNLPQNVQNLLAQPTDLTLILVGKSYLRALGLTDDTDFDSTTVFFTGSEALHSLPTHPKLRAVGLNKSDATRYRCGLVGLKGEIVGKLLIEAANHGTDYLIAATQPDVDLRMFIPEPAPLPPKVHVLSRPERVDFIIKAPPGGWAKPHQSKLRFFIPDWDDHVDPDYDFLTETHAGGKGNRSNQMFAHQMYGQPSYDGLLVSKMVADESKIKRDLLTEIGIHQYLRVPKDFPVMGDCGAFSYLLDDIPPYSSSEILEYYTRLGFTYGVSIDHLLFGAQTEAGMQARYDLTIQNAEDFITEHRKNGLDWTPIGAVQGASPAKYAEAAKKYIKMGYTHLGLGGMVRSKTDYILQVAHAVNDVVPAGTQVHLFGVARVDSLTDFVKAGITSADSASFLRQAWIRFGQNYIGDERLYAAIRIPGGQSKTKRLTDPREVERILALEAAALSGVRGWANRISGLNQAVDAVVAYSELVGLRLTPKLIDEYRLTLDHRPWEQCGCAICKQAGVEVLLFRGNNRNRRRGFHNTYMFYRLMQQILTGEGSLPIPAEWPLKSRSVQLVLPQMETL